MVDLSVIVVIFWNQVADDSEFVFYSDKGLENMSKYCLQFLDELYL